MTKLLSKNMRILDLADIERFIRENASGFAISNQTQNRNKRNLA